MKYLVKKNEKRKTQHNILLKLAEKEWGKLMESESMWNSYTTVVVVRCQQDRNGKEA